MRQFPDKLDRKKTPLLWCGLMLAVKKRFGKENGTVVYHGYQSFAPEEAPPK